MEVVCWMDEGWLCGIAEYAMMFCDEIFVKLFAVQIFLCAT